MTLMSAVNRQSINADNSHQLEESPAILESTEVLELDGNEAGPRTPSRGRRAIVVVMGMILAGVISVVISMTFVQGSWWYTYESDQALDAASLARVEAIRDTVDAIGAMPEVVTWLDAALNPNAHPTDVRTYLMAAQRALKGVDDPRLVEAAQELRSIMQTIRSTSLYTTTHTSEPTLEWPW